MAAQTNKALSKKVIFGIPAYKTFHKKQQGSGKMAQQAHMNRIWEGDSMLDNSNNKDTESGVITDLSMTRPGEQWASKGRQSLKSQEHLV